MINFGYLLKPEWGIGDPNEGNAGNEGGNAGNLDGNASNARNVSN